MAEWARSSSAWSDRVAPSEGSLEQALERLEEIADKLEDPALDLDEAVRLYEEGLRLYAECAKARGDCVVLRSGNLKRGLGIVVKEYCHLLHRRFR